MSIENKKHELRLLEMRVEGLETLRKKMQECWDMVEHEYSNDALIIQNLKDDIHCAKEKLKQKAKDLTGKDMGGLMGENR